MAHRSIRRPEGVYSRFSENASKILLSNPRGILIGETHVFISIFRFIRMGAVRFFGNRRTLPIDSIVEFRAEISAAHRTFAENVSAQMEGNVAN